MSVRSLTCPKCQTKINVPAAMQTARCPACGSVFTMGSATAAGQGAASNNATSEDDALRRAAGHREKDGDENSDEKSNDPRMIYLACAGALAIMIAFGVIGVLVISPTNADLETQNPEKAQPVFQEATPAELASLNIVNIPEERRRRIYDDMRKTARMTKEKPLMIPGTAVRGKLEGMLDATYENSIQQLAALHDLRIEDIRNIVKEGDMKNWDPRARSRAYRGGERVYEDEKTQGYKGKNPI